MDPQVYDATKLFVNYAKENQRFLESLHVTWEIVELYHPGYDAKIQKVVPVLVADYKV